MIFAAGLGTRLRPLTNDRPKALVEIAGKTMLERVITKLAKAGFNELVVNVHHFGDKIIDFLEQHDNFGIDITISDERDKLLDTGGGILKARQWLDGDQPFLIHNTDIITDLDLDAMWQYHNEHNAMATLLVKERNTARYLLLDSTNRLHGWINKDTGIVVPDNLDMTLDLHEMAFGGIHIITPDIFPLLKRYAKAYGNAFSIIPFYLANCERNDIRGYEPTDAYTWFDIGKHETLQQAEEFIKGID